MDSTGRFFINSLGPRDSGQNYVDWVLITRLLGACSNTELIVYPPQDHPVTSQFRWSYLRHGLVVQPCEKAPVCEFQVLAVVVVLPVTSRFT